MKYAWRVQQAMHRHAIKARGKRKFVVTTDSKDALPNARNLLNREFTVVAPDRVWSSDITYIATGEGWLDLAAVIDLFSRQVVGWSMQPRMQASLVTDALGMAWFRRQPESGLVFHSGMKSSMSRKSNCRDNAPTESLWGCLKVGRLYGASPSGATPRTRSSTG